MTVYFTTFPAALEKLQAQPPSSCGPVEVALPGLVFDLSSLVLYGAQAVPVKLKILLDRLYSVLTPEQVGHILHTLGWSLGDYVRGYMLQYPNGKVLDRWSMVTPEEELLILKQFLRFGETRPIVELMTLQRLAAVNHLPDPELNPATKRCHSNTSTFMERSGRMPAADLVSPSKLTQCLQRPSGTHRLDGARAAQENESKGEPAFKIKADPDKPNAAWSPWHQTPRFHTDFDHHRGMTKHENTSPSLNSSLIPPPPSPPPPSSFHQSISSLSSSPLKISQKLQSSVSCTLRPLPSFSSSFLCPLPTSSSSSFSSSLHPLPSSLCSLRSPSSSGGRKGRVCCGVCGKSFYDKGTLKIHYNAVHLKIKHRCTVAGCTMVFSSLRSRNRHSANPNPRLHTGTSRDTHTHRNTHSDPHMSTHNETQIHNKDIRACKNVRDTHIRMCREKETRNIRWRQDDDAHTPPQIDSPASSPHPRTLSPDTNQDFPLSDLHPHAPPPPLLPAHSASSLGSSPSLAPLEEHCRDLLALHTNQTPPSPLYGPTSITMTTCNNQSVSSDYSVTKGTLTNRQAWWESDDPTPKKKPRKSSMPVKIEREKVEGTNEEEEKLQIWSS
ncbi:hypothetical protein PAMA_013591 [Pampus argenteus]